MSNVCCNKIRTLIQARYPFIYVISGEEQRPIIEIIDAFKVADPSDPKRKRIDRKIYIWSYARGLREITSDPKDKPMEYINNIGMIDESTREPNAAINAIREKGFKKDQQSGKIYSSEAKTIFFMCDLHPFIKNDISVVRNLRELALDLRYGPNSVILIAPELVVPLELKNEFAVVDFPLPDQNEVEEIYNNVIENIKKTQKDTKFKCTGDAKEKIVKSLLGLSDQEIRDTLRKSYVETRSISLELIVKEKEQIIRKDGTLEFYSVDEKMSEVGGLENLKSWAVKRASAFKNKAREFGLPFPKGMLLLGIPGTGKSLVCKAMANLWNFPLLKMDIGALFGGIVGATEANFRKAIKVAESVAPCILMIDEIEKGLSGGKSSNMTDGGTAARAQGTFLQWMQDRKAPVFIVATSNDISQLPPEFLRKGRFDEIFFVGLPNVVERAEIFKIHLTKRHRNPENFDIGALVNASEKGYSGAEIEAAVISGLFDAYDENDDTKDISTENILQALKQTIPLSVTMKAQIDTLKEFAATRARSASLEMRGGEEMGIKIEVDKDDEIGTKIEVEDD